MIAGMFNHGCVCDDHGLTMMMMMMMMLMMMIRAVGLAASRSPSTPGAGHRFLYTHQFGIRSVTNTLVYHLFSVIHALTCQPISLNQASAAHSGIMFFLLLYFPCVCFAFTRHSNVGFVVVIVFGLLVAWPPGAW